MLKYPKPVMRKSELEGMGFPEECLLVLSGKLNDVPSGRLFRADFGFLQMCQSL